LKRSQQKHTLAEPKLASRTQLTPPAAIERHPSELLRSLALGAVLGAWQTLLLVSREQGPAPALGASLVFGVGILAGLLAGAGLYATRAWITRGASLRGLRWIASWALAAPLAALALRFTSDLSWNAWAFSPVIGAIVGFGFWVEDEDWLRTRRPTRLFLPLLLLGVGGLLAIVFMLE
jgi:hypothetical protein